MTLALGGIMLAAIVCWLEFALRSKPKPPHICRDCRWCCQGLSPTSRDVCLNEKIVGLNYSTGLLNHTSCHMARLCAGQYCRGFEGRVTVPSSPPPGPPTP